MNNELGTIYDLLKQLGLLDALADTIVPILLKIGLAFTLLNCFFGYRLRKLWSCIFGILLGIGSGLALAFYLDQPAKIALVLAAVGGILCMALAFLLYRIGMFFLCIGAVIMTLFQLFPTPTFSAICGFVVFGLVMGFAAVISEHTVVIAITAICGGIGSAKLLFHLTDMSSVLMILLAVLLSALGLVFQLKPWKDKEYWKKEKDKNTKSRQDEKDRRKNHKTKHHSQIKKQKKKRHASRNSSGRQQNKGPAQDYTRSQSAAPAAKKPDAKPSRSSSVKQAPDNTPIKPAQVPTTENTSASTSAGQTPYDTYTVDLSDIRNEISKEVQDIYQETHKQ